MLKPRPVHKPTIAACVSCPNSSQLIPPKNAQRTTAVVLILMIISSLFVYAAIVYKFLLVCKG